MRAAAERGYTALAIADVNGLYGAVHFQKAAEKVGLQPIIGTTLQIEGPEYCIVLVTSETGYRQCCRLLTNRHLHTPFVLESALQEAGTSDLLFLSRSPSVLHRLAPLAPPENVFALIPRSVGGAGARMLDLWDALPVRATPLAVPESWLINPGDCVVFGHLCELRKRGGATDEYAIDHPGAVLPNAGDWQALHSSPSEHWRTIAERCTFRYRFGQPLLPKISLPDNQNAQVRLGELCEQRIPECYPSRVVQTQAKRRLDKELGVICANGFADYFLYVNEITDFAHAKRIPVGVRGSAAASIVSYLLGFTHTCPIEHDLYFERFMNPGRLDCPDIDLDIADNRRDEVIAFCYEHWGKEHVAMIATVQFYRARGALRAAARLLKIPRNRVSEIIEIEGAETRHPRLFATAAALVGRPRHLGVHCGGLVITPCPIVDVTPLARSAKGLLITHYEKDQAEAIGLVKMDLLGNSALSVIEEAETWLVQRGEMLREPEPLHDYNVNRLFARGDTLGVYQCESPGMRQLCRAIAPTSRKETAMAISLIRPGPAAAGMKDLFIRRRRKLEPVDYLHPRMRDFLQDTCGVMLYQEDVMKIAVHLAGYSIADADALRRIVGKLRRADTVQAARHNFVFQKAAAAGLSEDIAVRIWDAVARFATYSYCKAHASVYARLAWRTARLKAHFPQEFYAAILNRHSSMYPPRVFVWDARRHHIPVHPPSVTESGRLWEPRADGVLAGLGLVRGLSMRTLNTLLGERAREPFHDLAALLRRVPFIGDEAKRLILVDACRSWGTREALLRQLEAWGRRGRQPSLFRPPPRSIPSLLDCEMALTGIPFCLHPAARIAHAGICLATDMGAQVGRVVEMAGILDACKSHRTEPKNGARREMSFLTLEDVSGMFDVVLFPDMHETYATFFNDMGPYLLRGRVLQQWDSCSLQLEWADRIANKKEGLSASA